MVHVVLSFGVDDYEKWKKVFNEEASLRKSNGSQGGALYRRINDPNRIAVALEWDTVENFQKFIQSDELKQNIQKAGIIGTPNVSILKKVEDITD